MKLHLEIKENNDVILRLVESKKNVASIEWRDNNSLSLVLLEKIDKIIRGKKTDLDKISGYKIISHIPKNWTSVRIAETTLKSLMIAGLA